MIDLFIRFIKRLVVLLPGLIVAYFVTTNVYPVLHQRIPTILALLIAYIIAAYIMIPAIIRLARLIIKPRHLPLYCVTPDGFASDPINIGLVGSQKTVFQALEAAGWHLADSRSLKNLMRLCMALVLRRPYPNAPFSNLYLFGRKQDFGFQLPVQNSPGHRHHVRFWASEPSLSQTQAAALDFWSKHRPGRTKKPPTLWLGAASLDIGLGIISHNGQLTHMVHPNTDAERDLLVRYLQKTGLVVSKKNETIGTPYKLRNRVFRGRLDADGKMTVVKLKASLKQSKP